MKYITYIFLIAYGFVHVGLSQEETKKIDRFALANRHNVENTKPASESVFMVGNVEVAFNVGITGLQTFPDYYTKYPLVTMVQWGWHSFPNVPGYTLDDASEVLEIRGEKHQYPSIGYSIENPTAGLDNPAYLYLRENPHKINLSRIGFDYQMLDGRSIEMSDIKNPNQKLDLWNG